MPDVLNDEQQRQLRAMARRVLVRLDEPPSVQELYEALERLQRAFPQGKLSDQSPNGLTIGDRVAERIPDTAQTFGYVRISGQLIGTIEDPEAHEAYGSPAGLIWTGQNISRARWSYLEHQEDDQSSTGR